MNQNPFPSPVPEPLARFPVIVRWPVQWGDMDAFGHVNNTIYLRWFETARIAYFEQSGMDPVMDRHGIGPILASATIHYRRQTNYPDSVLIGVCVSRLGSKSYTMEHAIYSEAQQAVVADGTCVIVAFDYERNASTLIPDELRTLIERFEGPSE